jgi:hypothetical protein
MKRRYESHAKRSLPALRGQAGDGLVVEAQVEDGVHHARHRRACARAHRQQQRVGRVAEALAHFALDEGHALQHLASISSRACGLLRPAR